jgi:hypothetical protein
LLLGLKPKRIALFFLGGLPLATIFFGYNWAAYGHPLETGYSSIGLQSELKVAGVRARFNHYAYWLAMTMSPLLLLGWAVSLLIRGIDLRLRVVLIAWFGAFLLFYTFYDIYDAWWYTRFLLPGYPALILGALLTARKCIAMIKKSLGEQSGLTAGVAMLLVVLSFEWHFVNRYNVFITGKAESVNVRSCRSADRQLPANALIVAMQMSGALKFYTERPIVRWDLIAPDQWQLLQSRAAERGLRWFALLQAHEVEEAKKHMPGKWIEIDRMDPISLWQIEP